MLQLKSCLRRLIDLSADRSLILVKAFPWFVLTWCCFLLLSSSFTIFLSIFFLHSLFHFFLALIQPFSDKQKAVIFINLGGPLMGLDAWTVRARSMLGVSDVGGGEVERWWAGNHLKGTDPWGDGEIKVITLVFWFMLQAQRCAFTPLHCLIQCVVIPSLSLQVSV